MATKNSTASRAHYSPPWADVTIIGVAGSSGSGKSTLSHAIVSALNLPWVVILSMDSFYKSLTPENSKKAFQNEWDFDSPEAIDFDNLVDRLNDLKQGKRAEIPIYSFTMHQRQEQTTSIYSPHVLILEGIFALYDKRVLDLLDMKMQILVYREGVRISTSYPIPRLDLMRRMHPVLRDVAERGRDIQGVIKQWFAFVKPNFESFVEPQRKVADIIVPRGVENRVALKMVTQYVERKLFDKSALHRMELKRLGKAVEEEPLSKKVVLFTQTLQLRGMNTIIQDRDTLVEDFIFYFDRLATLLIEYAMNNLSFVKTIVETPAGTKYHGLQTTGEISAVVILRAGSAFETGLKRVIPDCKTGRILIQSNIRTGEPELHFIKLPDDINTHQSVLLLDPQMSSGGAALMAVQVLVDYGVPQENIVFVTYFAGKMGLNRLTKVFPEVNVLVCKIVADYEERWIEKRYFGC